LLSPYRGHHVVSGTSAIAYFGPVELWLGVAAHHLGRLDEAVVDLQQAQAACVSSGATAFRVEAQHELAAVLVHRATPDAMLAKAQADVAAVLAAYDFGSFTTIADICGGQGHLLRAVLDAIPTATGVLFDLPGVIESVPQSQRLTRHPGDFFGDSLPRADAYMLMEVLHDWPDREASASLQAIRRAANPGAVVLIIESVMSEAQPDIRVHTLDVIMLAITSENAFAGLGGGIALDGRYKPVVEFMYADFMWVAADQLFNQIGKARHMFGGDGDVPFVLRSKVAIGTGYGSQHSMDPAGVMATAPGWRIAAPSTPFDRSDEQCAAMQRPGRRA
jgi:hypothetical protein